MERKLEEFEDMLNDNDLAICGIFTDNIDTLIINSIDRKFITEKVFAIMQKGAEKIRIIKDNLFILYFGVDFSREEFKQMLEDKNFFIQFLKKKLNI